MNIDNRNLILRATSELGDWFSRLGGGNRYFNMVESEIFLYVACKTLDQHSGTSFVDEYVHPSFIEHGQKPIIKSNEYISKVSASEQEVKDLVLSYLLNFDEKLRKNDEISIRWTDFIQRIGERNF